MDAGRREPLADPMGTPLTQADVSIYRGSRWKACLGLLGSVAFVILGFWLLSQVGGARTLIAGWSAIVFFGLIAPLWASAIVQPNRLRLSSDGFSVKQALLPEKHYRWADIDRLWVLRRPIASLVVWTYRERPKRLAQFKALLGQPNDYDGYLPAGWELPVDELASRMNAIRAAKPGI